jgi:CRP-like cAMP-binding protein
MTDFEPILNNFQKKGVVLSESEIEDFCKLFKRSFIKKRQFIVQPGFVNKCRTYIVKGTFRGYVVDNEGQEHTISFAMDDWWVSDFDSFIHQKPSTMFVVALEDSIVLQIDYSDEQTLKASHHKFEKYFRVNAEKGIAFLLKRLISNLTLTAEERYEHFLENYAQFVNRVPQYALASYLGMTTEYLSRIRNRKGRTKS